MGSYVIFRIPADAFVSVTYLAYSLDPSWPVQPILPRPEIRALTCRWGVPVCAWRGFGVGRVDHPRGRASPAQATAWGRALDQRRVMMGNLAGATATAAEPNFGSEKQTYRTRPPLPDQLLSSIQQLGSSSRFRRT